MFAFNDKYLIKSMMSLVRDETKRIESLGLAPQEDLRAFIKQAVQQAIDKVTGGADDSVALETITLLHKNLSAVRLPGDFLKITKSAGEKLSDALAIDTTAEELDCTKDPSVEETLKPGERIAGVENQAIKKICSILDHITYMLGSKGNHEAAYLTEKTRFKIENLIDRNNK